MKAMKPIGHIVSSASFAHPEIILKRFVPFFADRIVDMATSHMDEEGARVLGWAFLLGWGGRAGP
jgi:hypothetical protein